MNDFEILDAMHEDKPRFKFSFKLGNVVTGFILIVVLAVMTTDIKLNAAVEIVELGLSFFIIVLASNLCYLTCYSSGISKAKLSDIYKEAIRGYNEVKKELYKLNWREILCAFCDNYVEKELEKTRRCIVNRVGIKYESYIKDYIGKGRRDLKQLNLTGPQLKAILKANNTKPIKLTPEMLYKIGRADFKREPLGASPERKRHRKQIGKVAKTTLTSLLTAMIALDFVISPSWEMLCLCLVKLLPVVCNCFVGYKDGVENVEIDTVNYMNDQADLMSQALKFSQKQST